MPYKPKGIEKLYYTMGEAAEMLNENTSLIRHWENEFDILKPKKNKKGNRLFTQQDIHHLKIIHQLVKDRGYTLEGAKKKLRDNKEDTINEAEIVDRLKNIRAFLVELREAL